MKKSSGNSQKLGSFLSPGAPNYREKDIENQKGWSSERVLQTSSSRRGQASLTPFNSGRTIPSKWDDAERWICSPVSGYANNKSCYAQQQQHQFLRRPKSKSGPIAPPGTAYYSNFSPTIPLRHGLVVKNLMMGSPFTTGVLAPDALSLHHYYSHDTLFGPPSVSSAPLWSDLMCDPSPPNSQDEKRDGAKNEDTVVSSISQIDKGTQMSPPESENDEHSSPKSSPTLAMDEKSCNSAKLEIRDVLVDNLATVVRWSESYASNSKLSSLHGKDLKKCSTEDQASGLDNAESTFDTAKFEREEAKIIVWESLQKAKAEAAIRKLEMKLEKKRSSSMDKILNKLRRAQMKAEKMRSLTPVQQDQQASKTWKLFSLARYAQLWSPSTCFASHAS